MMKFKDGDRVHVTRYDGENVDFYGNLKVFKHIVPCLYDCSIEKYNGRFIISSASIDFGPDKEDYYTLVTDEEDTEKPEIQYISDMYNEEPKRYGRLERRCNKVELKNHYIIEVKKGSYVQVVTSNDYFRFTEDIKKANVYEDKSTAIRHAELIGGRVINIKRHVEV